MQSYNVDVPKKQQDIDENDNHNASKDKVCLIVISAIILVSTVLGGIAHIMIKNKPAEDVVKEAEELNIADITGSDSISAVVVDPGKMQTKEFKMDENTDPLYILYQTEIQVRYIDANGDSVVKSISDVCIDQTTDGKDKLSDKNAYKESDKVECYELDGVLYAKDIIDTNKQESEGE